MVFSGAQIRRFFTIKSSVSGGLAPQTPHRGFAPGPHWGTSVPQIPSNFCSPRENFLATPLMPTVRTGTSLTCRRLTHSFSDVRIPDGRRRVIDMGRVYCFIQSERQWRKPGGCRTCGVGDVVHTADKKSMMAIGKMAIGTVSE